MPSIHVSAEERRRLTDLDALEAAPVGPPRLPGPRGRGARRAWVLVLLLATAGALLLAGVGSRDLVKPSGGALVADFLRAAAQPRLDPEFLALTADAAATTIAYAVLGTGLSLVIGLVGGVLTSQVWWQSGSRGRRSKRGTTGWLTARAVLVVPRGVHEVVWGLLFLSILGIQPLVAVLAIAIPFGAITAKVFSEILDETGRGPYLALIASGASRPQALLYGLLPVALKDLTSYGFYRLECAIRSAAILGLVGLGGLGYELSLSFQSLRYDEIWTLLYALIALCALADLWSSAVRSRRITPAAGSRDRFIAVSLAVAVALLPLSAWWVHLQLSVLWDDRTWSLAGQVLSDAWPPNTGPDGPAGLLNGAMLTLAMSLLALVIAFLAGLFLAFPAANMRRPRRVARHPVLRARRMLTVVFTRTLLITLRAIPPPVWALMVLFVFYPGLLTAALALGIYTAGVLGRLMAEVAEDLDPGPIEAMRALGAPEAQVFCYSVLPAAAPRFVAYGLYRWEVTIRETVVVGVVGAGGLGLLLSSQLATFDYGGAVGTLVTLIALTLVVDLTSAAIRRSLR